MQSNPRPKFIEAATIQERVEDVESLVARLEDDPGDPLASSRLETIFRSQGDWHQLVELLLDRAEQHAESADPSEYLSLLDRTASIYESELGDPAAALMVRLAAFRRDPGAPGLADALDQLAHRTGQWDQVLEAYMIAAGELGPAGEVGSDLWLRIACAHLVTTGDTGAVSEALDRVHTVNLDRAARYLDVVEERAGSLEMLDAVVGLCRRIGDRERMSRALSRGLVAATNIAVRARYHEEIAALAESGGDLDTARWHYTEALRLDPRRSACREALVAMYRQSGDHREVAELLSGSRFTADQTERAELALEAAAIYEGELDEHTRAVNLYAFALSQDPTHTGAALPLAERYWHAKRWQELGPILDLLLGRYDELGPEAPDRDLLAFRAGRCHAELGDFERAREALTAALQVNPDHLDARLEYARVAGELGDHDGACDGYNAALVIQRRRRSSPSALADTMFRMAETRRCIGDDAAAATLYESALDLAYHRNALQELQTIYQRRGAWRPLVHALRAQLPRAERRDKVELLSRIAEVTASRLQDPHGAIDAYEEARSIDPDDRDVLCQLIEYYSAAEMWESAVEAILRVAEIESDPIRRGKYYQAAGTISRHHLDAERAVEHYNQALDCFFVEAGRPPEALRRSCLKAFVDLSRCLYEAARYKDLERNYRAMIRRMRAGDPELAELWHGLGQVYRKHLRRREEAIESFEVASALDNRRLTHHRILIDLYRDAGPDQIDKAIARRHALLEAEPFEADHYRALRRLYLRTGRRDQAWTAARALCYLGQADPEERKDFHSHRRVGGAWPTGRLTDGDWARLRHPDESPLIGQVLAIISEAAALESASSPRRLGLRDDANPAFDHLRRMFMGVVGALGLPPYEVCVQPEIAGEVLLANVRKGRRLTPMFAVGRGLYEGRSVEAILYGLARSLTAARPATLLRLAMPTLADLEGAFFAAVTLSRPEVPVAPALHGPVTRYRAALHRYLPATWRPQLAAAVEQLLAAGEAFDLARWSRGVDATGRRAGLLACGDLSLACAAASREPGTGEADIADLVVHSVSPAHHELRARLGLAVDGGYDPGS